MSKIKQKKYQFKFFEQNVRNFFVKKTCQIEFYSTKKLVKLNFIEQNVRNFFVIELVKLSFIEQNVRIFFVKMSTWETPTSISEPLCGHPL